MIHIFHQPSSFYDLPHSIRLMDNLYEMLSCMSQDHSGKASHIR